MHMLRTPSPNPPDRAVRSLLAGYVGREIPGLDRNPEGRRAVRGTGRSAHPLGAGGRGWKQRWRAALQRAKRQRRRLAPALSNRENARAGQCPQGREEYASS